MNDEIPDSLKQDYYTKPFINIIKYMNEEYMDILKKLNIKIENKDYTNYEFSLINSKLIKMRKLHGVLDDSIIDNKKYMQLLHTFSKIENEYNL